MEVNLSDVKNVMTPNPVCLVNPSPCTKKIPYWQEKSLKCAGCGVVVFKIENRPCSTICTECKKLLDAC
jgi:hypothetical protein